MTTRPSPPAACWLLLFLVLLHPASGQEYGAQYAALLPGHDSDEEVKKPDPFSDQELRVLRSAPSLPLDRLIELMQVYEKLDNPAMMETLVRAILKKDPANAEALRVRTLLSPEEELRPIGYLEGLGQKVLSGQPVDDVDSVPVHTAALIYEGRAVEAVTILETLRQNQFKAVFFPYLDDLGYAYAEAGRYDDALATYHAIADDGRYPTDTRQEALALIPGLQLRSQTAKLRAQANGDADQLVALAADFLADRPDTYEAIIFYIDALDRARRYEDVIAYLQSRQDKAGNPPGWPYLPTLAHAHYAARQWDQASDLFRLIQPNPAFDAITRLDAESMLLEIHVGSMIDGGLIGLEQADIERGRSVLDTLERDFPNHPDTLGYRAIYLAKTGKSDQALALLQTKRTQLESQGIPFSQLDALADVYSERKEYDNARQAINDLINDPRQDPLQKETAVVKLAEINLTERIDEGFIELQDGNRQQARLILNQAQQMAPGSVEVAIFAAEVELAFNRVDDALSSLEMLKQTRFPGNQPFPGQNALANAQFRTGQYQAAFDSYTAMAERPGYTPDDRMDAVWQRRLLRPLLQPTLAWDALYMSDGEGKTLTPEASFTSGWYGDWRFNLFTRADFYQLNASNTFLADLEGERMEGGITVQRRLGRQHFVEATIGGQPDGLLYGVRLGKFANPGVSWAVGFDGNARATQSASIGTLNGRQNRIYGQAGGQITDRWQFALEAYHMWSSIDGVSIGQGYGINGLLEYVIFTETVKRPELALGYFFEYDRFNSKSNLPASVRREIRRALIPPDETRPALALNQEVRRAIPASFGQEVFDSLIDPLNHRHGLQLTLRKRLNDQWSGYLQAGVYYAIDQEIIGYILAAGAQYSISETALIYAELRLDSSGQATSSGQNVIEANIGGIVNF